MPTVTEPTYFIGICPTCKGMVYRDHDTGELRRIARWGVAGEVHECPSPRPSSPEGV